MRIGSTRPAGAARRLPESRSDLNQARALQLTEIRRVAHMGYWRYLSAGLAVTTSNRHPSDEEAELLARAVPKSRS